MATGNAIQGATGPASPPSGAAGGDLTGTYPNPSVVAGTTSTAGKLQLDGAASDITVVGTSLAAGAIGKAADAGHVHAGPGFLPADYGWLTWAYDPGACTTGASAPLATGGTVYVVGLAVRNTISVTNILTLLQTNGSVLTSGQCFVALYPAAGGTLIGQSADQSTAWGSGATKLVTMPLSGGPFNVNAGIVYAAFWFNGTTGPAFMRTNGTAAFMNAGNLAGANSRWGSANTGITTTAPGTLGTISSLNIAFWAGLS